MFWKKEKKVAVTLSPCEVRLMRTALLNFRNKTVRAGKPTEDINELILRDHKVNIGRCGRSHGQTISKLYLHINQESMCR